MANQEAARPGSERFEELFQAGRSAFAMGNLQQAHDFWKEAARLSPFNEQVWLALLDVIDNDEDKRVCLQNILQINPMNVQARRALNLLVARKESAEQLHADKKTDVKKNKSRRRGVFARAFFLGVIIGLSGIIFAIVLSILIYAR
jgi:thioredoxin-like negative regulator of GroEL